jgi:tRNA G18 (ribose-2'-O)-methylase SpoU
MGMQRYENIVLLPDERQLVAWARARGLHLAVFEREQARVDLWRAALPEQALLVFGSENEGVPADIVSAADEVVGIPMAGINNSFPVTVAAGIAMAEWTRRHYHQK